MKKETIKFILILALISWISHFLYFSEFGFYEDDYINIPQFINSDISVLDLISQSFSEWSQGHPLAFVPGLLTIIGTKIGGLEILYIIAYLIVTLNSVLMYFILRKVYPESDLFCFTGALVFCLFPPDTAKIFLMHAYVLQISMMYFLISTLLYLNNRKILSYIIISMSLFSYETAFMLFYGVPFLKYNMKGKLKKELVVNFLILSSFLLFSFLYRKFTGEERVSELSGNLIVYLYKAGVSVFIGPLMNGYLFLRGAVVTMLNLDLKIFIAVMISFIILCRLFYKTKSGLRNEYIEKPIALKLKIFSFKGEMVTTKSNMKIFKLAFVSVVFLGLAYTLSFTHYPPIAISGRLTSVHLAATFGGSMFAACLSVMLFEFFRNENWKILVFISLISGYLSLLVGYRLFIQNDFVLSWKYQRSFWTQVTNLCPDLSDETLIFVLNNPEHKLPVTKYISTNSWSDELILSQLYEFPKEWKIPPRLFILDKDLESRVKIDNEGLKWKVPFGAVNSHWEILPDSNIVILHINDKKELVRSDKDNIILKGKMVHLKTIKNNSISSFEKRNLYDFLITN